MIVVWGEEGGGGKLGKTQNVELTLSGMKTPLGRSLSFICLIWQGLGFGRRGCTLPEKEGREVSNTEIQRASHSSAERGEVLGWRELGVATS